MNYQALKSGAEREIARYWEAVKCGKDISTSVLKSAERVLELCDDVIPHLLDEEIEALKNVPPFKECFYAQTDAIRSIKIKYGLTWSEVEMIRRCFWR